MTTVGLLALAMKTALEPGGKSPRAGVIDPRIRLGFAALYREIGTPTGQMGRHFPMAGLYLLWSVERIGMLYNLKLIGGKD